jgi:tRNA(fMet)-specific endonuclease VapC
VAYLLDSDVLSAVLAVRPNLAVVRRLAAVPPDEQTTSAVNAGELLFGAIRRDRLGLLERVEALLDVMAVVPFDESAARVYARLRADLEAAGTPLAEPDLRIAATALAYGLTLVTANERHFRRVPELALENWLA